MLIDQKVIITVNILLNFLKVRIDFKINESHQVN